MKDFNENENAWWNRMETMSRPDFKLMPLGYIKKYQSYVHNILRYRKDNKMEENKNMEGYYEQIKHLKTLLTEEQRNHLKAEVERAFIPDIVRM